MIPSFSIVVETENLETADQEDLLAALQGLARQTVSPARAREVVLVNSGRVEPAVVAAIRDRFPWVLVHTPAQPLDYYAAKSLGAALSTGEIVVFFDSDVQYDSHWLESLLDSLGRDPVAEVMSGETSIGVSGPYSLAVLLSWAFPPWSRRDRPYPTSGYAANNVAFRRLRLAATPIPLDTGLRRGNCTLHGYRLARTGAAMLCNPRARAVHPVLAFRDYYPRLWGAGYNEVSVMILEQCSRGRSLSGARAYALQYVSARRCLRLLVRCLSVGRFHPRWWIYLPAALPLALSGLAASLCGVVAGTLSRSARQRQVA